MLDLHSAAYNADHDAVLDLLRTGHDPNGRDDRGCTALYWCCFRGSVGNQIPVASALLDGGASPDVVPHGEVDTALTAAIQSSNTALVRLLLERGASPDLVTSQGVTPLMAAAREGHEGVVRMLLERGASRDPRCEGFSAADYARQRGHKGVACFIDGWR
jgi:ankyrin repeat protein